MRQLRRRSARQEILKALLVVTADWGERCVLVAIGKIKERKCQGMEDGLTQVGMGETAPRGLVQGLAYAGAQAHDLDEVVEVPRLEGRILPIIRKAQELLVLRAVTRVTQPVEDGHSGNGGRGGPTLASQLGQLGSLIGLGIVEDPSSRIKQ